MHKMHTRAANPPHQDPADPQMDCAPEASCTPDTGRFGGGRVVGPDRPARAWPQFAQYV